MFVCTPLFMVCICCTKLLSWRDQRPIRVLRIDSASVSLQKVWSNETITEIDQCPRSLVQNVQSIRGAEGEEDLQKVSQVAIAVGHRRMRACYHLRDTHPERDWLAQTIGDFLQVPVVVPLENQHDENMDSVV